MSIARTALERASSDVEWLQMGYAEAQPQQRPQRAGLLGLALADLGDLVEDGDQRLPALLRRGLDRLEEASSDPVVRAALNGLLPLRTGMLRWRLSTLAGSGADPEPAEVDRVIIDLDGALGPPWCAPPTNLGLLAAPHWCLAAALLHRHRRTGLDDDLAAANAHALEAMIEQSSPAWNQAPADGPTRSAAQRLRRQVALAWPGRQGGPRIPTARWAKAAPRARQLLGTLEPGHPMRPLLRTMSAADVLQELMCAERWPDHGDAVLADLRAVPELWGSDSSAVERYVARSLALHLGCARLWLLVGRASDPEEVDLTELDSLDAEFEALRALPVPGDGSMTLTTPGSLTQAGFFIGGLLMTRAAVANSRDGGVPDPADLARSEELLRDAPPEWSRQADALVAALPLIRPDIDEDPGAAAVLQDVGKLNPDYHDAMGGRIAEVLARAKRAIADRDVTGIVEVLPALQDALRSLPSGHPVRAELLAVQANLLGLRAALGAGTQDASAALHAAIGAAEIAPLLGREQNRQVCDAVALNLVAAIAHDLQVGPFACGQHALEASLAAGLAEDAGQALRWKTGVAAALALRWPALDADARADAVRVVADAERTLRALPAHPMTFASGFPLFVVLASLAATRGEPFSRAAVIRVLDHLEERLSVPGAADALASITDVGLSAMAPGMLPAGMPFPAGAAGLRAVLGQLRQSLTPLLGPGVPPMPAPPSDGEVGLRVAAALRVAARALDGREPARLGAATELLTRVIAQGVSQSGHREQVHAALGRCHAAAAGVFDGAPAMRGDHDSPDNPADAVQLAEAVRHLVRATTERADPLPTVEQVDLLDLQARCHHARGEAGPASDVARAALREVLGSVLLAETAEEALVCADRAHRISLRALWWCLQRDDLGQALAMAEAGRALVLASVVLAGRVQEQLMALGREDLATAWAGDEAAKRAAALAELTATYPGLSTVAAPDSGRIAGMVIGSSLDAAAYLVPPADPHSRDGVLLLVGRDRGPRAIALPGLVEGSGSPVDRYRRVFAAALSAHETATEAAGRHGESAPRFRETPQGQEWSSALDRIGQWAHRTVISPLLDHVQAWNLGRPARVTLIPLGELAAVPFAAAWTEDPTRPSGRRYAIHDLVLSHIASARVLSDVARRDRLPLQQRAVLVTDPKGTLPHARVAARAVHANLLPAAVCYWPDTVPAADGATRANILAELPADGREGASLLHLATHGRAALRPLDSVLEASDGLLRVGDILAQARRRDPHAPGGLVICDACLTDTTHAQPDESLTLATAFLTAGATAVIGTRWPTDDDAAAALAYRLHHALAQGQPPANALRLAQLALLDGAPPPPGTPPPLQRPRRPQAWADWAAYVHHGV
jgi:hypothetical protein